MLKYLLKKNKFKKHRFFVLFFPSTTDHQEKINKVFGNINLHPVDCRYDDFSNYSDKNLSFLPHHLDSRITSESDVARQIVQNFLRHAAEMSNSSLVQNATNGKK